MRLDVEKIKYSQVETYSGAFLTDFFSFFMIVATAATLFIHKIPLLDGTQAAIELFPPSKSTPAAQILLLFGD